MSTTEPSAGGAPAPSDKLDKRVLTIAGVVVLGAIMSILDITVVSVALPTWQKEFDATTADVAWTHTAYTLALAVVIPMTGWAADRFGPKKLYLMALTLFTLGSVLCAFATSLPMLIAFRVVQGFGGGMLMPLGMAILTKAAGPERIGRVMAVMGVPMLLGPIFGPILGGWLIENLSWHWIFLINLPIGIAALVYTWFALDKDEVHPSETFDFVGVLLLSPGLASFLYGVSSIPHAKEVHGSLFTGKVIGFSVVGIALIIAFCLWALNKKNAHPLLDLTLFKNRNLTIAVIAMSLFGIAFSGSSLLFPTFFQSVQGYGTTGSGGMLAPQGIGAMVMMPAAGLLVDRIGPGKVVMAGAALVALGMGMFTVVGYDTGKPYIFASLFVMGLGMGATMMPIMTAALATLREAAISRGSTTMNIISQVANACGAAVFSVLITTNLASTPELEAAGEVSKLGENPDPSLVAEILGKFGLTPASLDPTVLLPQMATAFTDTFVVATVLLALVLVPAFFLPRRPVQSDGEKPMMMH
ncbi:DHA2 family efflux MFS transporter permease subunit [Nocardioides yefusunii]|uniref:DHA2 family efflux MFS transporter permease subunit n=1 Tax=Nocardioides yefusunii TaxID=2500546 RepID=A0ABW1QYB2_9ACTN|nr:DHA2 family efflux MFS transporter permease subunit [Nocardioides yefusunii]